MNKIATNLTPQEVKALNNLNNKLQDLSIACYCDSKKYDNSNPEPKGLYQKWLNKIVINSDNSHVNQVVNHMLTTDIAKFGHTSINDAENVIDELVSQINDYYRLYWQSPQEMAQCINILRNQE